MPQQSSNQNLLLVIFIILLGFAGGYLYSSQVMGEFTAPALPSDGKETFEKLKALKADFSVLTNKDIQALRIFGESPVNPGATGKSDLFAP